MVSLFRRLSGNRREPRMSTDSERSFNAETQRRRDTQRGREFFNHGWTRMDTDGKQLQRNE